MQTICFICEGNTCRSPFAEKIFNKYLKDNNIKDFKAISCGYNVTDNNINENVIKILKNYNINVKSRKPKKLTKSILQKGNLFITMTVYQKQFVNAKNVFSFGEIVGGHDIDDPYNMPFEYYLNTTKTIENYCKILIDKIINLKENK